MFLYVFFNLPYLFSHGYCLSFSPAWVWLDHQGEFSGLSSVMIYYSRVGLIILDNKGTHYCSTMLCVVENFNPMASEKRTLQVSPTQYERLLKLVCILVYSTNSVKLADSCRRIVTFHDHRCDLVDRWWQTYLASVTAQRSIILFTHCLLLQFDGTMTCVVPRLAEA